MTSELVTLLPHDVREADSTEYAFRVIRASILSGQIPSGATLSQANLARTLGISRTPLREALNRLTGERLIVGGEYNQRMRVSDLDLDDFDQIYAVRIALEPVAVMSTVGRLDDARKDDLKTHVDEMDAAILAVDMTAFRNHHRAFHLGLTALAGERIERLLGDLWDNSERYRLAYLHYDYSRQGSALIDRLLASQLDHRHLFEAARDGDGERCASTLVAHLDRTLQAVFREASDIPRSRVGHQAVAFRTTVPDGR